MLSLPKHQPSIFKLSLSKLTLHSQPSKLQRRRSIQQSSIRTAEGSSEANLQSAIRNLQSAPPKAAAKLIFNPQSAPPKAAAELICNPYVKTPTSNYPFHSIFRIPLTVN
jgi:hypothetical protein